MIFESPWFIHAVIIFKNFVSPIFIGLAIVYVLFKLLKKKKVVITEGRTLTFNMNQLPLKQAKEIVSFNDWKNRHNEASVKVSEICSTIKQRENLVNENKI